MRIINLQILRLAWIYLIGYPLQLFGRIVQISGVLTIILLLAFAKGGLYSITGFFISLVCYMGGIFAIFCSKHIFLVGKRITAKRAEQLMMEDKRNPVLFLRSFREDKLTSTAIEKEDGWLLLTGKTRLALLVSGAPSYITFSSATTEEEMLANELKRIGPCIAVGSPGERLPPIGMARRYFDHENWETEVQQLIEQADLVVMRAGFTTGFLLELKMAVKILHPKRLLILLPSHFENKQTGAPNEQSGYTKFRRVANEILLKELPELSGGKMSVGSLSGMIWFESDWTPKILRFDGGTIKGLFEPLSKSYAHNGVLHWG